MRIEAEAARRFLLGRIGLLGRERLAPADLADLGMIQIDTIRIAGARNHELAVAARADVPAAAVPAVLAEAFVEQHYPVHWVRRDWRLLFAHGMAHRVERARIGEATDAEIAALEARVLAHVRENGATRARDLDSERVPGGFDTLKATTLALERLYRAGHLQVAGRTDNFERLLDLAERLHPGESPPIARALDEALVREAARSALLVLRLATPESLVARTCHHLGPWRRDAGRPRVREIVLASLDAIGAVPVDVVVDGEAVSHLVAAEDVEHLRAAAQGDAPSRDDPVRIVPPLDNLLFDRARFARLFGMNFLFEAYKPKRQRSAYFAMPILHRGRLLGILDPRLVDGRTFLVERLDLVDDALTDAEGLDPLRAAVHRLARLVGAVRVSVHRRVDPALRRALAGRVDPESSSRA